MDEATKEAINNLKETAKRHTDDISELYGKTNKNTNEIIKITETMSKCAQPTGKELQTMKDDIKIAKELAAARKMTAKDWVTIVGSVLTLAGIVFVAVFGKI